MEAKPTPFRIHVPDEELADPRLYLQSSRALEGYPRGLGFRDLIEFNLPPGSLGLKGIK